MPQLISGQSRQLELAEIALTVLDALPKPDQRPVFTGWVSHRAGLDNGYDYWVPQYLYNLLRRLHRMGLVDLVRDATTGGYPYWRLTEAGERFEGSAADIARPMRNRAKGRQDA